MSESDEDDTDFTMSPLSVMEVLGGPDEKMKDSSETSFSMSSVGFNDALPAESQLIEALTIAFGKLRPVYRDCVTLYPDEVRRLIVFGPRLFSFAHRDVCSIRHPRTSCIAWQKRIGFGPAQRSSSKQAGLDAMSANLVFEANKWAELAAMHDAIMPKVIAAVKSRDDLRDDDSLLKAIARLWSRATGTLPSDGLLMTQEQYCLFETRMYTLLYDKQSLLDALDPIEKDYLYDARMSREGGSDGDGITFEAFTTSMLEVADNWTATGSPHEYAALLYDLLIQMFAPEWSADADAAFQVFLSRRVMASRATLASNAADARKSTRTFLSSSDASEAQEVMNRAAAEAKATVQQLLDSVVTPKPPPKRNLPPRPPAKSSSRPPSFNAKASSFRSGKHGTLPPLPVTVESLADTAVMYAHLENQQPRAERELRAKIRLKLQRATPTPLYVAVKSKLLAFSSCRETEGELTERVRRSHFEGRSLAVQSARWRLKKATEEPML